MGNFGPARPARPTPGKHREGSAGLLGLAGGALAQAALAAGLLFASALIRAPGMPPALAQPVTSSPGAAAASAAGTPSGASARSPAAEESQETLRIFIVNAPPDARTGRWDPRAGAWEFEPPAGALVRVEWGPWQAQARKLRWQPGPQVAELSGDVVVRRPDLEANASRATLTVADRRARLEGGVRVVQYAADGGQRRVLRTLSAQTVELDDARQVVEAYQAVRVEQAEPAFWARGDEMVYNHQTGRLVLTARGGVVGEAQGYRLAQAPKLEYNTQTGEVLLFGPANLQQVAGQGSR